MMHARICATCQRRAKLPAWTKAVATAPYPPRDQASGGTWQHYVPGTKIFMYVSKRIIINFVAYKQKEAEHSFQKGIFLPSIQSSHHFTQFYRQASQLSRTQSTLSIACYLWQEPARLVSLLNPHAALNASCSKHVHRPLSNGLSPDPDNLSPSLPSCTSSAPQHENTQDLCDFQTFSHSSKSSGFL